MKGFSLNKFIIMLVVLFMLSACTILNNWSKGFQSIDIFVPKSESLELEINLTAWKELVKGKTIYSYRYFDTDGSSFIDSVGSHAIDESSVTTNSAIYSRTTDNGNKYSYEFSKVTSSGGSFVYSCYNKYHDTFRSNDEVTFIFKD